MTVTTVPAAAIDPTTKHFGTVDVGDTHDETFTVTNTGTGSLHVGTVDSTGSGSFDVQTQRLPGRPSVQR